MVGCSCNADDGYAVWSQRLVQGSPQVGEGALVALQPKGPDTDTRVLTLSTPLAPHSYDPLQLAETHSSEEWLMKARAVLLKSSDQLSEQLLALLLPQVEDMPNSIHHRVDAAQSIKISRPVGAPVFAHQLLVGAGEGGWSGGDKQEMAEWRDTNRACRG
ncbi:hypothetical protein MAE02_64350 [Microvirga aerophila]|uniref:Uncharacterized protein n=1 Tax=Microvirga aerophila TaxID=670291 RepID=A0A512C3E4_9HYPH|nr:hypothetical protein MAE02_64350 [Microvirga aerophila]